MACVAICSEITEYADPHKASCIKVDGGENGCVELSGISESCPIKFTHITVQERQTIYAPVLEAKSINYLSPQGLEFVSSAAQDSNINQHSPPRVAPLLYLHLRNIRI
jgi:hypothetical protein